MRRRRFDCRLLLLLLIIIISTVGGVQVMLSTVLQTTTDGNASDIQTMADESAAASSTPKSADVLGVPKCQSHSDCAYGGACLDAPDGDRHCLCSASCPITVPLECHSGRGIASCLTMGDAYRKKYSVNEPACHKDYCVCPPMFDPIRSPSSSGFNVFLPTKCDKRELKVLGVASPSDSVYKGTIVTLFCCINMDPRGVVASDGVDFIQNGTIIREPSRTPFDDMAENSDDDNMAANPPMCWQLAINNVQFSDSGKYLCHVKSIADSRLVVNATIPFVVKDDYRHHNISSIIAESSLSDDGGSRRLLPLEEHRGRIVKVDSLKAHLRSSTSSHRNHSNVDPPRMIQNLTVRLNATSAEIDWHKQEGPMLKIDMRLMRRTDNAEVWSMKNAKSPLLIDNLRAATPYTLFITVIDGQSEPVKFTEQFTTTESAPGPPQLIDTRALNAGDGAMCEIEWKPPKLPNGRIIKYYVTVRGTLRYIAPGGALATDHYPQKNTMGCANYNNDPNDFVNAADFNHFFSCRYGPLKPNRNYTATIMAENSVNRSAVATFERQCVTNYAEPELIEQPDTTMTSSSITSTSFPLRFASEPLETNGPIACYYVAIVPLMSNVPIERLPPPETVVMDSFAKTISNNLNFASSNGRYFAYIAESYMSYPQETIIGDGNASDGLEPCNVLYLSRYKAEDPDLRPGLKYTGFLIVRVDRDESVRDELLRTADGFLARRRRSVRSRFTRQQQLQRRQLHLSGPAYGFSAYFKPIYLEPVDGSAPIGSRQSWHAIVFILVSLLLVMLLSATGLIYFLRKKGLIKDLCPGKKHHERVLIKPTVFQPIAIDELPSEYIIRHRDSDFLFTNEFDNLPHYNHSDASASERRENQRKNRYNDIKAFDATRVKLSSIASDTTTCSDYINANFVQGYKGRKTFIAAQGPLDHTIDDFWRMIWEHRVQIIVMVSNLYEKYRCQCSKYWPEDESTTYDQIEVRPINATYYSDYAVRTFEIRNNRAESNDSSMQRNSYCGASRSATNRSVSPIYDSVPVMIVDDDCADTTSAATVANRSNNSRPVSTNADIDRLSTGTNPASLKVVDTDHRPPMVRTVVQYHYTGWNDYRAPDCTTGLLRFLAKLRRIDAFNQSPVVVHCSAGVGRTGTFIAIDGVLDQCQEENRADIFGFVSNLRRQRNFMVQSLEQYVFVYKAIAEWYLFGDTDIESEKIVDHVNRLRQSTTTNSAGEEPSNSSNVANRRRTSASAVSTNGIQLTTLNTDVSSSSSKYHHQTIGIDAEYKRLERTLDTQRSTEFARKDENRSKNRFESCVPYDRNRVILSPLVGYHGDASYINASVVKGYFYPYILTQDPLDAATCNDFWRMIIEQNATCVVMLSCEDDISDDERYWPVDDAASSATKTCGRQQEYSIRLGAEEEMDRFATRQIILSSTKDNDTRDIVQFVYRDWPNDSVVPMSTGSLLQLIGRVLQRQSYLPNSGPIVLHCRNGSSRSGLYCCISLLLERLKAENRVDVFQTVKSLQAQRPMILANRDQYEFCYQAVLDYLESFR